ncbi:MAG: aldehyde ferredoxin oxidoreductase C-terminal domain-containing protein, partial [Planctomycetota bacterium]
YRAAEKALTVERMFNLRAGLTRRDDWIPERIFDEGGPSGEKGLDRETFRVLIDDYYSLHGWNPNGIPTDLKKKELGLEEEPARWL